MDDKKIKKFVNEIFKHEGVPAVTNFAAEFSDGALFVKLFNILYGTNINCMLSKSTLFDDKLLNWNRINACICFNYLQQRFYLVEPTMKTLAKGKSSLAVIKLIKVLLNESQANYGDTDSAAVKEIADVLELNGKMEI